MSHTVKYEEMTPTEFLQAIAVMPVFFVPTGLLEWHGDHLPLGLDALKAYSLCLQTAGKLGGGIVLPANYYGRPGFSRATGTLTFSEACMDLLFSELFEQLAKVGAKVIVLLTGHYGPLQVNFVKRVAEYFMSEHPAITIIAQPEYEGVAIDGEVPADHAGKWETSLFWHLYPDLTHMERFEPHTPRISYPDPPNDYYKETEEWKWQDLPLVASQELGQRAAEIITDHLTERIRTALASV